MWAVARHGFFALANLGLFLSPVVVLAVARDAGLTRRGALWGGAVTASVMGVLLLVGARMPFGGNVLYDLGLGPSTVHGAIVIPGAPGWMWWLATFIAVGSATLAIGLIAVDVSRQRFRGRPDRLLLLGFACIYLVPLLAVDNFFDRYLLAVLAPLTAILLTLDGGSSRIRGRRRVPALALLAGLALFGVLGTHDYLEHNRARWSLLDRLIVQQVPADRVDGGFEFAGWFGLHPVAVWQQRRRGVTDDYIVSHLAQQNMVGFRSIEARKYRRWLPPRMEGIELYERLRRPLGARGKGKSD
jgi:hypothetical protein